MEKIKLRKPFFVVNPKSYLYGEEDLQARQEDGRALREVRL